MQEKYFAQRWSRFRSQFKAEFLTALPKEWTLRQKWEYQKGVGAHYAGVSALLGVVLMPLSIITLHYELRWGFDIHFVPLFLIFHFGWCVPGCLLMLAAFRLNRKNGSPITATGCMVTSIGCLYLTVFFGLGLYGLPQVVRSFMSYLSKVLFQSV